MWSVEVEEKKRTWNVPRFCITDDALCVFTRQRFGICLGKGIQAGMDIKRAEYFKENLLSKYVYYIEKHIFSGLSKSQTSCKSKLTYYPEIYLFFSENRQKNRQQSYSTQTY